MLQGSVHLALNDLLIYIVVGAMTIMFGMVVWVGDIAEVFRLTNLLTPAVGILLIALCYVAGFVTRSLLEWIESAITKESDAGSDAEFRAPFQKVCDLTNLSFTPHMRRESDKFEAAAECFTKLLRKKDGPVWNEMGSQGVINDVESDLAERSVVDSLYLSRLGTLATFAACVSFVLMAFSIAALIRMILLCEWGWWLLIVPVSLFLGLICRGQHERLLQEIRFTKVVQGISSLVLEARSEKTRCA